MVVALVVAAAAVAEELVGLASSVASLGITRRAARTQLPLMLLEEEATARVVGQVHPAAVTAVTSAAAGAAAAPLAPVAVAALALLLGTVATAVKGPRAIPRYAKRTTRPCHAARSAKKALIRARCSSSARTTPIATTLSGRID